MESFLMVVFVFLLAVAIMVAISRWVFRINTIVKRLDEIIVLLAARNTRG